MRTAVNGARVLRGYSHRELRSAHDAAGIDGLLIDHRPRGIEVALDGTDDIENRPAYRLSLTLPSGSKRHVWVDAQTFLEVKADRESHAPAARTIEVYYRNYRRIDGLMFPTVIESGPAGGLASRKMTIDDVTLNLRLSDARFARPEPRRRDPLPRLQQSEESLR